MRRSTGAACGPAARSRDRRAYISYPPPMPRELSNWFCPFRKTSHICKRYLHYDSSSKLRYEAPKEKRKKAVGEGVERRTVPLKAYRLMCRQVKELQKEYYNTPGMYYLTDKAAKEAKRAKKAAK